jgi:transposase
LTVDYPAIVVRARKELADIHWGDETGISCNAYTARGFAPKGKPPVIRINARKMHLSMISTITNYGTVRFMLYRTALDAPLLITFMTRLIKDALRKVFLILDNLPTHHSKRVKAWLKDHTEQIEVFYLPAYAPEYNPIEYLNSNLKNRMGSGLPSRSMKDLTRKTRSFMKSMQKRPHHVRNFFLHPKVAYAA